MTDRVSADRLCRIELASGWLEVWQSGARRSLWFDDDILQTEIDLRRPDVLPNPVNRAMLCHLLFRPRPRQVVLAGCGGGALARWFAQRLPEVNGQAIEIEPAVVQVARRYFEFPPPDRGWRIIEGDVRERLHACRQQDFLLIDIAQAGHTPNWVTEPEFLATAIAALALEGATCINIIPRHKADFTKRLMDIREAFDRRTLCLSVPDHHNILVLAFRTPPPCIDLETKAVVAERAWGIEFPRLLQRLQRENPRNSGVF